jgi:hypothetical protein
VIIVALLLSRTGNEDRAIGMRRDRQLVRTDETTDAGSVSVPDDHELDRAEPSVTTPPDGCQQSTLLGAMRGGHASASTPHT